ncbi:MAG: UDP-N-acetylmuramoyl-L-alanine--D-glutamate ligase [Candidatus Paceibacterota bacterium]|jgi:UDP-N-acetylmuramoylalanine--D-glutamate ligase
MKIESLKNKKILILGFGQEGLDTFLFLKKKFPRKEIFVADIKGLKEFDSKSRKALKKAILILGKNYLSKIKEFDVIIKTPGIPLSRIKRCAGQAVITSQTELFLDNCKNLVVGITGTKGKSTASALLYHVLKKNGFDAYLVGNIEAPALPYLEKAKKRTVFVYEMSCHQLDNLKKSPSIAVFLNIYPEHLDYYKNFKEYFSAKANIALHQKKSDYFVFNPRFALIKGLVEKVKSKAVPIKGDKILSDITHQDNLNAVFEVCRILKLNQDKVLKALKTFKKLPHRLEYVGEYKGIKFYDDSISTIPESMIYALDKLGDDVQTIIAGGLDRGIDFKKLGKRIASSKVKTLILFPDSGKKIYKAIKREINHYFVSSMEKAVELCFKTTNQGKICLLSPASSSYNLFKNFKERGDLFKKYVKSYEKRK